MSSWFTQTTSLLSSTTEQPKKKEWYEDFEDDTCYCCPTLTYQQRFIGFVICYLIGFVISIGSLFRIIELLHGKPDSFAIMYTIGHLVSICGSCFLNGPATQAKSMVDPSRALTTFVYFALMALTLFLAFYPKHIPVRVLWLLISIFLQSLALAWYTISFIPYARDYILAILKAWCCTCNCDCFSQKKEAERHWLLG